MPRKSFDHISQSELERLYHELGSAIKTAIHFGCGVSTIFKLLKRYEITPNPKSPAGRKRNRRTKYDADVDFFSRDNEHSFYWAGFIAADGNVFADYGTGILTIGLSVKDLDRLEKFKRDIRAENPIRISRNKVRLFNVKGEPLSYCSIAIRSTKLTDDLCRFNVVPAKTKVYSFPEWLIKHPMVHHFLRGYVDGDGSFSQEKALPVLKFSLYGNVWFLEVCQSILVRACQLNANQVIQKSADGFGALHYGGNRIVERIRDFLYRDATIYLDRKLEIANRASTLKQKKQPPTHEQLKGALDTFGYDIKAISRGLGYNWRTIKSYLQQYGFTKEKDNGDANCG